MTCTRDLRNTCCFTVGGNLFNNSLRSLPKVSKTAAFGCDCDDTI
uniref:Spore coat protein n=1 Tax=Ascaris lumbricoides TaxID=6252 RepID=A0A0M3IIA2_ASCLU